MAYTQEELEAAFKTVQSSKGWKYPIDTYIRPQDRELVTEAIIHFTATVPKYVKAGDKLHVTAVGYLMGPAGP